MPYLNADDVRESLTEDKLIHIVDGTNMQLAFETLKQGQKGSADSHANEQVTIVLRGSVEMRLGDETRRVSAGDVIFIPPWQEHQLLDTVEECFALDIFTPPKPRK